MLCGFMGCVAAILSIDIGNGDTTVACLVSRHKYTLCIDEVNNTSVLQSIELNTVIKSKFLTHTLPAAAKKGVIARGIIRLAAVTEQPNVRRTLVYTQVPHGSTVSSAFA